MGKNYDLEYNFSHLFAKLTFLGRILPQHVTFSVPSVRYSVVLLPKPVLCPLPIAGIRPASRVVIFDRLFHIGE